MRLYLSGEQQQQSSQVQKIQTTTKILDTLVKEIKELRSRVKKLEETQQVQVSAIQLPPINIPLRLDISNTLSVSTSDSTSPVATRIPAVGLGIAKKIAMQNEIKKNK